MRDRTADLLHAMQALSQLSYSPKFVDVTSLSGAHSMQVWAGCQAKNLPNTPDFLSINQAVND